MSQSLIQETILALKPDLLDFTKSSPIPNFLQNSLQHFQDSQVSFNLHELLITFYTIFIFILTVGSFSVFLLKVAGEHESTHQTEIEVNLMKPRKNGGLRT